MSGMAGQVVAVFNGWKANRSIDLLKLEEKASYCTWDLGNFESRSSHLVGKEMPSKLRTESLSSGLRHQILLLQLPKPHQNLKRNQVKSCSKSLCQQRGKSYQQSPSSKNPLQSAMHRANNQPHQLLRQNQCQPEASCGALKTRRDCHQSHKKPPRKARPR